MLKKLIVNTKIVIAKHPGVFLVIFSLYGLFLRVNRITVWKIYKDSFKYLFITKATSSLIAISDIYPNYADFLNTSFLTPYKWGFGFVTGILSRIFLTIGFNESNTFYENTAHCVVVMSGIFTIILVFKILKQILSNTNYALFGSFLFAISGAQSIWSGFIITDTFAGMILLLFVYFKEIKKNPILSLILSLFIYFTRLELIVVPFVFYSIDLLLFLSKNSKLNKLLTSKQILSVFDRISVSIFAFTIILTLLFSKLITQNLAGDSILWMLLAVSILASLFSSFSTHRVLKHKILILLSVLFLIYYLWWSDVSRYVNIVLPLLVIISIILYYDLRKKIWSNIAPVLFVLLLPIQLIYPWTFTRLDAPDYHTEVATRIFDLAETYDIQNIYVGQEEAYLWENPENKYNIIVLDYVENLDPLPNSLLVKDNYFFHRQIDDSDLNLHLFKEISSFTTSEKYRINSKREKGMVRVYYTEEES